MKNILFILLISFAVNAQTPFEKLDSLSAVVSKWQKMTEGTTYRDVNGKTHIINLPDENFKIWSHDRLASKAVYKTVDSLEVLEITEGIDLAKATGISIGENYFGSAFIRLDFPKGYLKTQVFENGVPTKSSNADHLEFFCRYAAVDANKKFYFDLMFEMVYALCNMMKLEQGTVTVEAIALELNDWNKLRNEAFLAKHPTSLMAVQAQLNIAEAALQKDKR